MNATIAANIAKLAAAQAAGIEVLNFTAGGWAVGTELVRGSFEMVYPSGKTCSCGAGGVCEHILLVRWHRASDATRALALAEIAAAPKVETVRVQGFELWDAEQHAQAVPGFIRVIGNEVNYSSQYGKYVNVLICEVAVATLTA